MGRNAIIFHGTGAQPDWIWYPWLAERLRDRGYTVEVPHHPGINVEPIATFLPKVLDAHTYDEDTVLVGHSGGAALLLSILERLDVVVPQAFLVAGYSTQPNTEDEPVLQESYHWGTIREVTTSGLPLATATRSLTRSSPPNMRQYASVPRSPCSIL